ncbi:hydroxysteroid dehydrogenase-like protein 1 [Glossina fuscipes]|uniref:Hydroxysteroid dehydrogenase-like protein 1 n=1 Tax=Glossina fuscipes TaxID=7396 RepID=A0A9C6E1C9_9MUSC|nr:hydroxysteroid dehydrogenase-like protein 1 [Glossina fuscipes]
MSRIVIPQMKKQGKGAVVNIASSAHWIPTPLAAVYGATKRYVRSLSLAMERELFKYNINVQCVEPWFVRTELIQFSDILSRNKYFGTPVDTFTRSAVFILGKTLETTGYWTHAIMTFFGKLAPEWLAIRGFHFISNYVRKDYLRNQLEGKEN